MEQTYMLIIGGIVLLLIIVLVVYIMTKKTKCPECPVIYITGRYVKISNKEGKPLNITSIKVFDDKGSVYKPSTINVTMSSQLGPEFSATNVLDDLDTISHTKMDDLTPWIMLDLRSDVKISQVVVDNRKDCCKDRIVGSKLSIIKSTGEEIITPQISDIKNQYVFKF